MIKLDLSGLQQVAKTAPATIKTLAVEEIFSRYQAPVENALAKLHAQIDTPGAFCRWLTLPQDTQVAQDIEAYAQRIQGQFDQVVHIGIGGSALGPAALLEALLPSYWNELSATARQGRPRFYVVDNVDADKLNGLLNVLDFSRTLVHVVSKSGGTMETMSAFMLMKERLEAAVGKEEAQKRIVASTDPDNGLLRELVQENNWQAFPIHTDVGGRFSIFTSVGLLPAALMGFSPVEVLKALQAIQPQLQSSDLSTNIAAQAAALHVEAYKQGYTNAVFMPYSAKLTLTADWFIQLWAESLGKRDNVNGQPVFVGQTPIRAVGVTDQHSQLQLFNEGPYDKLINLLFVGQVQSDIPVPNQFPDKSKLDDLRATSIDGLMQAEGIGTRDSLLQNNRPVLSWYLPQLDLAHFVQLLFVLQVQTAIAGVLLDINPFDQPGVELSKKLTVKYLAQQKAPAGIS